MSGVYIYKSFYLTLSRISRGATIASRVVYVRCTREQTDCQIIAEDIICESQKLYKKKWDLSFEEYHEFNKLESASKGLHIHIYTESSNKRI